MTIQTDAKQLSVLVVDDDQELRDCVARYLARKDYSVQEAASGVEALDLLLSGHFDVAILDLGLPGMSGMEVLGRAKEDGCSTEVIVLTGCDDVKSAVSAMQFGAQNYLTKPVPMGELTEAIQAAHQKSLAKQYSGTSQAAETSDDDHVMRRSGQSGQPSFQQLSATDDSGRRGSRSSSKSARVRKSVRRSESVPPMLGNSPKMKQLFRTIERAGRSEYPILIQGESGTGKELVAKALHAASARADQPMITINCAALPESLLESELFGHEKGSYTGATTQMPGLFEVADGGTLFIDEVGELAPTLQPKLLRVLEDGSFRRVGCPHERHVDVRIIAATNRKMDTEVAEGRFRQDLYYRINVMTLELPRLQERGNDILHLASYFAGPEWDFEDRALQVLEHYHWPGNVRQLINVIDRAKVLADDYMIRAENFPAGVGDASPYRSPRVSFASVTDLASVNRACVMEALRQQDGNKKETAKRLGVSRRTLYRLLEKHNIQPDEIRMALTAS
ncbi:sigma-54-dependent transcriptional regulator [Neorhodopirellula lusitana]|uniref:sigma-54-dependent transcriptional regulator n=1 Tax=Neorhodopirellula lusitana TaxID=445327 RepID=UPI0038510630